MLIVKKDIFTWVCVQHGAGSKQRKEGKWDLREETGTALSGEPFPDPRLWTWKCWEGQKKKKNNSQKWRIYIPSPKIPDTVGKTASIRSLCYQENKNIGFSFPFLPSWVGFFYTTNCVKLCFKLKMERNLISWERGKIVDVSYPPVFYFKTWREGNFSVHCRFYQKQRALTNILQSSSGFSLKKMDWGVGFLVMKAINKNWESAGSDSLELWLAETELPFPFRSQIFKLIQCFIPIIQMIDSGNTLKIRMKRFYRSCVFGILLC